MPVAPRMMHAGLDVNAPVYQPSPPPQAAPPPPAMGYAPSRQPVQAQPLAQPAPQLPLSEPAHAPPAPSFAAVPAPVFAGPTNAAELYSRGGSYRFGSMYSSDEDPQTAFGRKKLLRTRPGLEGAFTFSGYHYQEPDISVLMEGLKYGLEATGTYTFSGWFVSGGARFAYGLVDYKGSGTDKDHSDYIWEIRATGGRDFMLGRVNVSPYTGLGYRFLYNDNRGVTSTGALGYERESQYVYIPFGVTPRFNLFNNGSRIALNLEYDLFLYGNQRSYLSKTRLSAEDLENEQDRGWGLRGSILYEGENWSAGPFFNYWNIATSSRNCNVDLCGYEPMNQTYEFGLRLAYRFWDF